MVIDAGTRLGRYEIRWKLGEGGMGEVYLARDTELGRDVALKILPAAVASNSDRRNRFIREAQSAAALSHPNIAQIFEIGQHDGTHYISMEFIDGVTLRDKIYFEQTELPKLLRHLQHVAEGLAKAHAAGIVHRDLKPDNIMITRDDHAKILDFGLAKLIEPQQTSGPSSDAVSEVATAILQQTSTPGMILGTAGYMSPEQAQGKVSQIDHRSDIFSFGCILYEAITRHKAFEGKDAIDTLNKIIREPVIPISDYRPDAPEHVQRVVRRCLAKDPEDRYQTIKDVAIELKELRRELAGSAGISIAGAPSAAGPISGSPASTAQFPSSVTQPVATSSAEYIVTGIKKHKLTAAIALLVLVIGTVVLGMYLHARNAGDAIDSIAVLPFVNQSRDADTEYLSDGLTESIINNLTQLASLRVSPRSSVFQYKGKDSDPLKVGQELGVRTVLTGRLLQRGDSLMVSAELLDVRDNKQLWGEQYNRKLADALAVQQDISREISERLRTKLSGEDQKKLTQRQTTNAEAYQFYLKGRYYWSRRTADGLKRAIEQFQQAVEKDPTYALAYSGLADCYVLLEEYADSPSSETLPKARAAAMRALEIDDSLAEAHTSAGYVNLFSWQFGEAENELKRAVELNSKYPTGHQWYSAYLRIAGRLDESMAEIKRAQQLDPLSPIIGINVGNLDIMQKGDLTAAVEEYKKVIELDPTFPRAHGFLGLAYLEQGRHQEAIASLQKGVELSGRSSGTLSFLGYGYGVVGKRAEAMAILKELEERYARRESPGIYPAAVYAGLGDKDQAFAWLEKDFQARTGVLVFIAFYPHYETLRSDPRYTDLLRRIGLRQ